MPNFSFLSQNLLPMYVSTVNVNLTKGQSVLYYLLSLNFRLQENAEKMVLHSRFVNLTCYSFDSYKKNGLLT